MSTAAVPRNESAVLALCKKQGVKQVIPVFSDVLGRLKAHAIPAERLAEAFERGVVIDGSSIEGYARIEESDLRAKPDPATLRVLPWTVGDVVSAIIICDVVKPDGSPFEGDPRFVLRRLTKQWKRHGWDVHVGPEMEFFYFRQADGSTVLDKAGYYDLMTDTEGFDLRTRTMQVLQQLAIKAETAHHEVSPSQQEISLQHLSALEMADTLMIFRWVVKEVAERHGMHATFMPKPLTGTNGSGMHLHCSIFKGDGSNLFFSTSSKNGHLSPIALQFLAGLLRFAREIALVTNPTINSYKRLVPGFEAPVYICWGSANRSALIRKPNHEPGREKAVRLEARFPDPSANPYLAIACLLSAGVKGIDGRMTPPAAVEKDVYSLGPDELARLKIETLPSSLEQALQYFSQSALARSTLGEHIFDSIIRNASSELRAFQMTVTDWETERYF